MVSSSSRSRSRSDRRGPSPKKASEDVEAKASADASAPEGAVEPKTSTKPAEAAAEAGTPAQPSYSQSRRPGEARKNVRKAGDAGTWECPDCYRVIQDNESSKDQHRVSAYCFSRRLWKVGAFYVPIAIGSFKTTSRAKTSTESRHIAFPGVSGKLGPSMGIGPRVKSMARSGQTIRTRTSCAAATFYQVKAPKAYLERPRSPPAQRAGDYGTGGRYDRNRHREARSAERSRPERGRSARLRLRSKSGDKKHRGRKDRAKRSADRREEDRAARSADRRGRDRGARSADPRGKEKRAARSDSEESVTVEDEEKHRSKPAAAAAAKRPSVSGKEKKEKTEGCGEFLAKRAKCPEEEKKEASSDEYTYTSSPEDQQKNPKAVAAKSAAKAGAAAPAAKPAAANPADSKLAMMNSLLKTAMETAAKL